MSHEVLTLEDLFMHLQKNVFKLIPEKEDKHVGLETEMLLFHQKYIDKPYYKPIRCSYQEQKDLLCENLPAKGWKINYDAKEPIERLKNFEKNGATLTFEGGGQLEYSSSPCLDIVSLEKEVSIVQQELRDIFSKKKIIITQMGLDPWNNKDEIGIQRKSERYELINSYYKKKPAIKFNLTLIQTTSLQICLDLGATEDILVKRYLAGMLIAPFAAAIFANSPYYEGQKTQVKSFRTQIWRNHDPTRNGFQKNIATLIKKMNRNACIEEYLNFSLDCPLIFYKINGLQQINRHELTFRKWLQDKSITGPNIEDYSQALDLLFPEVRVKGYLEFRSIDNQAAEWQMIPAAFYCGLLYDTKALDETMDLLSFLAPKVEQLMILAEKGLENKKIKIFANKLMDIAIEGFSRLAKNNSEQKILNKLQEFQEKYSSKGKTPADTLLDYLNKTFKSPQLFKFL